VHPRLEMMAIRFDPGRIPVRHVSGADFSSVADHIPAVSLATEEKEKASA
jgi:hypothetical protein